ncbi:MAG TPA: DUF2155 domain-containing protein [Geminicoccaceae bacterium]|nr:DUF2155 domain-containing protein [Geminicoccaceae bacterium]
MSRPRPMWAAAGLAAVACLTAGAARAQGPVIENRVAVLQGLDKVTARISEVRAPLDVPTTFGTLEIVARACRETPPTEPPESAAFLEIRELPPASDPDGPRTELFSGWMFASSPAVSALEHPVYDVWVVDCEEPIEARPDEGGAGDQGATEGMPPASP